MTKRSFSRKGFGKKKGVLTSTPRAGHGKAGHGNGGHGRAGHGTPLNKAGHGKNGSGKTPIPQVDTEPTGIDPVSLPVWIRDSVPGQDWASALDWWYDLTSSDQEYDILSDMWPDLVTEYQDWWATCYHSIVFNPPEVPQ